MPLAPMPKGGCIRHMRKCVIDANTSASDVISILLIFSSLSEKIYKAKLSHTCLTIKLLHLNLQKTQWTKLAKYFFLHQSIIEAGINDECWENFESASTSLHISIHYFTPTENQPSTLQTCLGCIILPQPQRFPAYRQMLYGATILIRLETAHTDECTIT